MVWVLYWSGARQILMEEAYKSKFFIHLGVKKMYKDLRPDYWLPNMKRDVAWYMERCLTCMKVNVDHHQPHKNRSRWVFPFGNGNISQ